jgi:DNA adenine methylase
MNNPTLCERENLLECSKALKNTEILSEDYKALLPRVGEGDFVYLDPPYVPLSKTAHFTSYTRGGFGEEEQKELKEFCDDLDFRGARFLLNNSDTELVRDLYSSFKIVVIEARRSLAASGDSRKPAREMVVTNY